MKKDLIGIKGTKNGIIFIVSSELSGKDAKDVIIEKLTEANGFFQGAKYNISAPHLQADEVAELDNICQEFALEKNIEAQLPEPNKMVTKAREEIAATVVKEQIAAGDTLLIIRNLRSGQTIKYEGNIVIVGDVNPGAEVYAGGNIIVLGKLRGIAHAGFISKQDAFILAYRLQPTQLRIDNHVSRAPETEKIVDYPEIARFSSEGIYIKKYTRSKS